MDIQRIKDFLLDVVFPEFDHDLLSDPYNDPFIHVSVIYSSSINPHRDSFGLYLKKPDVPAIHTNLTKAVMASALVLEAKYLLQKMPTTDFTDQVIGCTQGFPSNKGTRIIVVTVCSPNADDASFVCKTIVNKLHSLVDPF